MAKDVTYQKYKMRKRPSQVGFTVPKLNHFPWVALLIGLNVAVVAYHGDPRDMVAQASELKKEPIAEVVAPAAPSVEPVVAKAQVEVASKEQPVQMPEPAAVAVKSG